MKTHKPFRLFDFLYEKILSSTHFYHSFMQLSSVGQWERWEDKVFEDLTGKRVLEVGVGPGKLLLRMAKKGYDVSGIEILPNMALEARKLMRYSGYPYDIRLESVNHMSFKDEEFNCIVMTFVISEIQDLDGAIAEMKRVLKKGGKIIAISATMPQDNNLAARIILKMIGSQSTHQFERKNEEYFEKHGFKTIRRDFGPFRLINKIVAVK